jgi:hypothetical protein
LVIHKENLPERGKEAAQINTLGKLSTPRRRREFSARGAPLSIDG